MNLQESFGYILNLNARLIKRKLDTYVKEYDITTSQWSELALLSKENNLMQVEIANRLHADIATVGATTDRLVKKGLLKKKRLRDDKRAYRISITDKGIDIVKNMEEKVMACNRTALTGFTEEEINQMTAYLSRVTDNLTKDDQSQEGDVL